MYSSQACASTPQHTLRHKLHLILHQTMQRTHCIFVNRILWFIPDRRVNAHNVVLLIPENHLYVYTHFHIYVYTHTYIYMQIHTYIYIHIYPFQQTNFGSLLRILLLFGDLILRNKMNKSSTRNRTIYLWTNTNNAFVELKRTLHLWTNRTIHL